MTLFLGKVGVGKTSLFEAVYYCLTGNTSKEVAVDKLRNHNVNDNLMSISLELIIKQ
jgi:recombinational DNA repair ATPase RecF